MNFTNINSLLTNILGILKVPKPPQLPIPNELILLGGNRKGLNASNIAAEIIRRKGEAGLNIGPLPSGKDNPSELLIHIIVQVIIEALTTDAVFTVAVEPGIPVVAQGVDASGLPVVVEGTTTFLGSGYAIIQ